MLRAVIFDMDGTLGDTLPLCVESYRRCVGELTGRTPEAEEVEALFGLSDRGVLGGLLGMSPDDPELPMEKFANIYEQLHAEYAPHPFAGVRELLERLAAAGFRLAVVTGKESYTALPTLRFFGLSESFDMCLYGDPYCNVKAQRMREYMQCTGLNPQEVLYVGDMPTDIQQARQAGVRVACAAWAPDASRYETSCRALRPDAYVRTIEELETVVNSMRHL